MKYKSLPLKYKVDHEGGSISFGSKHAADKYKRRVAKLKAKAKVK